MADEFMKEYIRDTEAGLIERSEAAENALRALAHMPIEDMAVDCTSDDSIVFFYGKPGTQYFLTVGHVHDAREAIGFKPKTLLDAVKALRAIVAEHGGLALEDEPALDGQLSACESEVEHLKDSIARREDWLGQAIAENVRLKRQVEENAEKAWKYDQLSK